MFNFKTLIAGIEKLDGTNWVVWAFGVQAALMFINAWGIANGTETRPSPATATPTAVEQATMDDWDKRE